MATLQIADTLEFTSDDYLKSLGDVCGTKPIPFRVSFDFSFDNHGLLIQIYRRWNGLIGVRLRDQKQNKEVKINSDEFFWIVDEISDPNLVSSIKETTRNNFLKLHQSYGRMDIRQWFRKNDDVFPTRRGVRLTSECCQSLVDALPRFQDKCDYIKFVLNRCIEHVIDEAVYLYSTYRRECDQYNSVKIYHVENVQNYLNRPAKHETLRQSAEKLLLQIKVGFIFSAKDLVSYVINRMHSVILNKSL